jgi:antibiotic biosynthesis monooxygenase (ABM) superfamily enzyme
MDEAWRRESIRAIAARRNFPTIAAQKIEGYRGAELFVCEDGDEVEFVTLVRFDSMEAVKKFAGPEASKPMIFPKAEPLITRMEQAQHYRVAIDK